MNKKKKVAIFFVVLLIITLVFVGIIHVRKNQFCTIVFDTSGGEMINNIKVEKGTLYKLPEASKDGYIFNGWMYKDKVLPDSILIVENMNLMANWIKNDANIYTIKFESNGGNIIDDLLVEEGKTIIFPESPKKDGYIFDGWMDKDNNEITEEYKVVNDITIYAKWKFAKKEVVNNSNDNVKDNYNSNKKNESDKTGNNNDKNNNDTDTTDDEMITDTSETDKVKVICYPKKIVFSDNDINVWLNEETSIGYDLSEYYYLDSDGSIWIGNDSKCDEYNNSITWNFNYKGSSTNCSSIQLGENKNILISSKCYSSYDVYWKNARGEQIGKVNVFGKCRPVTGVTPKQSTIYIKSAEIPYNTITLHASDFPYTGSSNCTGMIGPNYSFSTDDPTIAYYDNERGGIGVFVFRGLKTGTTTAHVRVTQGASSVTASFNIVVQE